MVHHDKNVGVLTVECDGCSACEEFEGDFHEAWEEAKLAGWRTWKEGHSFVHYCQECRENK